ncbi:hypothetical protein FUT84_09265 [Treponema phagedenis]|nr:hypothetical protein FUT79_09790 [Treponema phagedenis]QEK01317.1 hypothetical protein FUT84_09265 [Treponema phagedenis]
MAKPNLRVLKLCKLFCFKTSFLLGTTGPCPFGVLPSMAKTKLTSLKTSCDKKELDTAQGWAIYHSDAESGKLYKYFCFKTSFLFGTTGVRARSEF